MLTEHASESIANQLRCKEGEDGIPGLKQIMVSDIYIRGRHSRERTLIVMP